MSASMDFEQIAAAWLATDGPDDIAPDAVDIALRRAALKPQRAGIRLWLLGTAPWPSSRHRAATGLPPLTRIVLLLALLLAAVLALAAIGAGFSWRPPVPQPQLLAIIRGDNVYIHSADGTAEHQVTWNVDMLVPGGGGGGAAKQLAWSPGGTRLAIGLGSSSAHATQIGQILITDANGRFVGRLLNDSRFDWADEAHLVTAPDLDCCWTGVWVAPVSDGSLQSPAPITQRGTGRAFGLRPSDGPVVALQDGYRVGGSWGVAPGLTVRIYLVSADGSRADTVGVIHGAATTGAISRDGRAAAFLLDDSVETPPSGRACPDGSPCLAIVPLDSSGRSCTTSLGALATGLLADTASVAWSPSGDRVALLYPGESRSAVAIVAASTCSLLGTAVVTTTEGSGDSAVPTLGAPIAWSRDGGSVFFRMLDRSTEQWSIRRVGANDGAEPSDVVRDVDWFDLSD